MELRQHNLLTDAWPEERFDLIWSRWVAMFLTDLEPLTVCGGVRPDADQPGAMDA